MTQPNDNELRGDYTPPEPPAEGRGDRLVKMVQEYNDRTWEEKLDKMARLHAMQEYLSFDFIEPDVRDTDAAAIKGYMEERPAKYVLGDHFCALQDYESWGDRDLIEEVEGTYWAVLELLNQANTIGHANGYADGCSANESVIKCAYSDLVGAKDAFEKYDIEQHDWEAHSKTIGELENTFDFVKE
tara:strand:- start:12751 stop:13308 length:558 start_codon:yes stop_codon:yes gene_type:complete